MSFETNCGVVYHAQGEILLGPEVLVLIPFFFFPLVLGVEGETLFPYKISHCPYGFHIKYLFPFAPIYLTKFTFRG